MKYRKLKNSELDRINAEEYKTSEKTPLIIILDNIRSLNNIGSVFRTADAFLVKKIYLCGITATPPHKDIQKTALGAQDSVEWEYAENTLDVVTKLQKRRRVCCFHRTSGTCGKPQRFFCAKRNHLRNNFRK